MRLIFAGTPSAALPSLEALLASQHEITAVLTRPPARAGRGRLLAHSPIHALADENGIEVLTPTSLSDDNFVARLAELEPDCIPVVAYGALVPAALLEVPPLGWVNLHFSLLPAWRGAAPVQHALLYGDDITGATTFRLDEGLDTGPVYGRLTENVTATDTSGTLLERLSRSGAGLLVATVDALAAGTIIAEPQRPDGISLAPKITAEMARIKWTQPALGVDRRVRACTPDPGAWTEFRGERLGLGPVQCQEAQDLAPAELRIERNAVVVGTATANVILSTVQPAGRRQMSATDWVRGIRPETSERFE